jgi:hypothetical protein
MKPELELSPKKIRPDPPLIKNEDSVPAYLCTYVKTCDVLCTGCKKGFREVKSIFQATDVQRVFFINAIFLITFPA